MMAGAQPPYEQWTTRFEPLQQSMIDGVAGNGARFIVAENLYMYGMVNGPMHEDLPYAPTSRKGEVRARMAEQVASAHQRGMLQTAAGRGSDFFGPRVLISALGERVIGHALRGNAAQFFMRLDQLHSYTYINDFGAALAILGTSDQGLGKHWHVPTPPALTQQAIGELLSTIISKPIKLTTVGRTLMRLVGLFNAGAKESVEMLYEFEHPFVLDSSRFTAIFGLQPTPLETALRATVAWYQEQLSSQL